VKGQVSGRALHNSRAKRWIKISLARNLRRLTIVRLCLSRCMRYGWHAGIGIIVRFLHAA